MSYTKGQSKLEFNNILLSNIRTHKNLYISLNYININKSGKLLKILSNFNLNRIIMYFF
jgi:hypothetical protein